MKWIALALVMLGLAVWVYANAPIAAAGYEAQSVRQAGGPVIVDTMRGCERLERRRKHFDKSRCKRKVHWEREFRRLPDRAMRWLHITGDCETRGTVRYFESYRVNGRYDGRYQFDPYRTAPAAGFTMAPWRVYYREQDVRAWRWRWNPASSGASEWPNCAAW